LQALARRRGVVHDRGMAQGSSTGPTTDAVLDEFVAARREQLQPGALRDCEDALDLLRDSLNGYAYDSLRDGERRRAAASGGPGGRPSTAGPRRRSAASSAPRSSSTTSASSLATAWSAS